MEDIKQRIEVEYTRIEKLSINRKLQILSLQIEDKSVDGINTIFDNQDKCGLEICKIFKNKYFNGTFMKLYGYIYIYM